MKSNVIFVKFHTRLESTDSVVVLVLVLVPRPLQNSDFEDKYKDENEDGSSILGFLTPET